jgi:poly-beta-1,6-N-acetyl-D-glucosamine synthase
VFNAFSAYTLVGNIISVFIFVYPVLMSIMWMCGAVFYWYWFEKDGSDPARPPVLKEFPKIALIVPCYNEEQDAEDTVENLLKQDYPNFEVIAINDGSKDRTGEILDRLVEKHPNLRVILQAKNQGKAMGLRMAALCTDAEYLMCIDGDALLAPDACIWMIRHFQMNPRLGAVTGNPRLRTRSTLLGRIQVGEFSSIIGLIKRAQRIYGRLFTVSGVCVMFRRTAIHSVGYWSTDMLCEDIDASWRLQLGYTSDAHGSVTTGGEPWDIRFEPAATCWILMPETLMGLWKQRLRWAMGGTQAILRYSNMWKDKRSRKMLPVYLEYLASLVWSNLMVMTMVLFGITWTLVPLGLPVPEELQVRSLFPGWTGVFLATVCLLQTFVAIKLDSRYDRRLLRTYMWSIWYPIAFWLLNTFTAVAAFPKTLARGKGKRAVWVSPDRGVRQ